MNTGSTAEDEGISVQGKGGVDNTKEGKQDRARLAGTGTSSGEAGGAIAGRAGHIGGRARHSPVAIPLQDANEEGHFVVDAAEIGIRKLVHNLTASRFVKILRRG